ncbi:MAG: pyrimidine 5'-nucleotidase, partial [Anaerolineae bacterium]|nr:pyrimidine 5'-nucleotidase [Anaerolineae bacterium]
MNIYMQKFIDRPVDEIAKIRQQYLEQYGTTLRGLQAYYEVDTEEYLAFVHDLPLEEFFMPDPPLRQYILSL